MVWRLDLLTQTESFSWQISLIENDNYVELTNNINSNFWGFKNQLKDFETIVKYNYKNGFKFGKCKTIKSVQITFTSLYNTRTKITNYNVTTYREIIEGKLFLCGLLNFRQN